LGNVHARQANWPAAREQYERSLKLNPKVAGTWYNLGRVLMAQGNPGEAIAHFTKALELQPAFSPAHNSLGYALALQGRLDEAIQHYEKALADKPDFAEAHFNLAEALARRGALELARTHFEAALQFQTNYAKAHVGLAGVFAAGRRPAPVVHHLREGIRLDPANPDPLNNLAWLLATHPDAAFRDGPEAVRLAARAVELTRTNDVEVLDTLAAAHAEAGQFSQAVVVAQQALELAGRGGPTNQLAAISSRLELYRQRVAHREP
jgi:tetratricopeptide (TPR) repeat protein